MLLIVWDSFHLFFLFWNINGDILSVFLSSCIFLQLFFSCELIFLCRINVSVLRQLFDISTALCVILGLISTFQEGNTRNETFLLMWKMDIIFSSRSPVRILHSHRQDLCFGLWSCSASLPVKYPASPVGMPARQGTNF